MLVFILFCFTQGKPFIDYYFTDKSTNDQVDETVPKDPKGLSEDKTHYSTQKNQVEDVTERSLLDFKGCEGQDEDVVDEIGYESDYAQGRTADPNQKSVEAEHQER